MDSIAEDIRHILFTMWDPLEVNYNANLRDEYDSFVGRIKSLVDAGADETRVVDELADIERELASFEPDPAGRILTARALVALSGQ